MAGFDQHLGKYQLKSQLGHGGMGVVYLATDTRLHRDVALKILPRQMSADQAAVGRFMQEARVVAKLSHPNVVVVHDVDQERGYCYLVMELLTGGTIQDALKKGPLPWTEATSVIAQACRGLAAAQEAGLIHRDIKPSNIMKAASGIVKLTDFGLAKIMAENDATAPMTKSGVIMGTPHFMSPEQCQGEPLDGRCDLYALGATYFALLIGRPPFADADSLQVMFAHCSRPAPDPCRLNRDIPAACGAIVLKALAKSRGDRFGSAREMAATLEQVLAGLPTTPLSPSLCLDSDGQPISGTSVDPGPTVPEAVPVAPPAPPMPPARSPFKRRTAGIALAFLLLVLISPFAWRLFRKADPAKELGPYTLAPRAELPVTRAALRGVAFSADSDAIFSASLDGTLQEWDVATGKSRRRFGGVKQGLHAVAASKRWLAAGGQAKTFWLWKLDSIEPHTAVADFMGEVSALAFSPDEKRLAVGTHSEVRLYEMTDQGVKLLKVLGTSGTEPGCYMVMSVAFSSDSRWLAATTWRDKRVLVWHASNGAWRHATPDLGDQPMAVAFVPGKEQLVIGLQYRGLVLWDADQQPVAIRASSDKPARALAVTPDRQTAITFGEWGGHLRLFDLRADAPARPIARDAKSGAIALALSPDGKLLASGGGDEHGNGHLHLFNVLREKAE